MHLEVFPCMDGYVGKFAMKEEVDSMRSATLKAAQTVVILDQSGSMGSEVGRITRVLLPAMLKRLHYQKDDEIILIAFSDAATCVPLTVAELTSHKISARGGTCMAKGLDMLIKYIPKLRPEKPLRIMVFSDGEVSDKDSVLRQSDTLTTMLQTRGFAINAQGFRWFTSPSQPDTSALASVLKLNTVGKVMLEDIDAKKSDTLLVDTLVKVFEDDGLHETKILQSKSTTMTFLHYPWQTWSTSMMSVRPGDNIFWLSEVPKDGEISLLSYDRKNTGIAARNPIIPIKISERLQSDNYLRVLSKKVTYFLDHLKLLKVNETKQASEEISHIVAYFSTLEKSMEAAADAFDPEIIPGMRSVGLTNRLNLLQKNIGKRTVNVMREIANDDKISRLSAQQTADYLRKDLMGDKRMKGLASRVGGDLDFDGAARAEVRAMHAHLHELDGIDDSTHVCSFLDLETTLSGIRATCELVDRKLPSGESLIDSADCSDVLRLLNIVGIACDAPIGTYPDPMTWTVNQLFLGTFCSMSDILNQGEADLAVPRGHQSQNEKIVNVIPFFDDVRIHKFLKKYAPRLLEFSAGEGMRRILGPVNGTFLNTICSGLLSLAALMQNSPSTMHCDVFFNLLETFSVQSGKYYDHILPYLHDQEESGKSHLSYYLHNNGVRNMMYPILQIIQSTPKFLTATHRDPSASSDCARKLLPRIFRALYSHEIWQSVKRTYKSRENPIPLVKQALHEILGIDLEKYRTVLTPLFEAEPSHIKHHDKYYINDEALDRHTRALWYLDSMFLIRPLFAAASKKDIQRMKSIPLISDDYVAKACDISYDIRMFRFYNVVQALIFHTKSARINDGTAGASASASKGISAVVPVTAGSTCTSLSEVQEQVDYHAPRMRFTDLKDQYAIEAFLTQFVKREYAGSYQSDLSKKKYAEDAILRSQLVQLLMDSVSHEETVRLFKDGTAIGDRTCVCKDFTSPVVKVLKDALCDFNRPCERRLETITLLLLGVDDEGNEVWNEGRALFCLDLSEYKAVFATMDSLDMWSALSAEHRWRNKYDYNRDFRNRHDHGRDRPSYWAMGFATIESMMLAVKNNEIPQSVFDDYCTTHVDCCGMRIGKKKRKFAELR
jgi:hypothetical protein